MNYLTDSMSEGNLQLGHLQLSKNLTTARESNATPLMNPNMVNGDSDADSGIVAIGPTRIGSASSTDTDPDVTLAYGAAQTSSSSSSSSSSTSSSSNRDSINLTPVPITLNQDKRKPIFQRVRFDDQQSSPSVHPILRKSLSYLSSSSTSSTAHQTTNQLIDSSGLEMRLNSTIASQHPSSSVLPKETHPLAHRRVNVPAPLPLKSMSSTTKSSSSTTTTAPTTTTMISKATDRSWSTLPRNNKTSTNNANTVNTAKWTSTLNNRNRTNSQSASASNGMRRSFLNNSSDNNKKPDLIESHAIKLTCSSSFRSSPDSPRSPRLPLPTSKSLLTSTSCSSPAASPSSRAIPKTRSCTTLNNHPNDKNLTVNGNSETDGSGEPRITKLCTIDPLESTDSMVCAFASVANVISDDSSSIVNEKVSVDKAVAAAVAAVNFVTNNNNQVYPSSLTSNKSSNRSKNVTSINDHHSNGHSYNFQEYSHELNNHDHFNQQHQQFSSNSLSQTNSDNRKMETETESDDGDNDNLDHQYEAIFPYGKTTTSNQAVPKLTALPSSSSSSSSSSSVPLEILIRPKAKGTIGNSAERESNQSSSVNSNESESSNDQRCVPSHQINSNNIAQQQQQQQHHHHQHQHHHHHHHYHPHSQNPSKSHVNNNVNGENVNPISTIIRYKSILKHSSTSSTSNWPSQSIHFSGQAGKKDDQDQDQEAVNDDNERKVELVVADEDTSNEQESGNEDGKQGKKNEEGEEENDHEEPKEDEEEANVVQKQDKSVPMASQINGPCSVPTSSSSSTAATYFMSSSYRQSINHHHHQYHQHNMRVAPANIINYLPPVNSSALSSTNNKPTDGPLEPAYLQPDQIYPNPLPSPKFSSSSALTPSSSSSSSNNPTFNRNNKEESQNLHSQQQQQQSTCEVEYATITKSQAKKNNDSNELTHSNHSTFNIKHLTNSHQEPLTSINYKFDENSKKLIVDNKLMMATTTNTNPIIKMTRFAVDVPDGVNYNAKCSSSSTTITSSSAATVINSGASNKWLTKRFGGLRKALSRAFSADRLPKDNDSNHHHNHHSSSRSSSNNNQFASSNSALLTSSLTASANLKSSLAAASSVKNISSSKSTPNLNCNKPQPVDSFHRNHSTEDLTSDLKSFVKSVKSRMSFRKSKSNKSKLDKDNNLTNNQVMMRQDESTIKWINANTKDNVNQESTQLWGELIELKSDGSQVIELNRSQSKPFGFFLARGTVNNVKGVFVSRMRDEQTQTTLTGLLEIGDEIIAIDGLDVKSHNIAQVNQLMSSKKKITLTVRPYINQNH